ncbi:MAG: hypothetical protein HY830_11140 [Actinobacteria bacterium]|nr:hypothetical protein [Actinomycetota bacterium]
MSQRREQLEKRGYGTPPVRREARRRVEVQLTPAGVELVDSVVADVMENESKLLAGLTAQEQEQLRGLLRKLLGTFE